MVRQQDDLILPHLPAGSVYCLSQGRPSSLDSCYREAFCITVLDHDQENPFWQYSLLLCHFLTSRVPFLLAGCRSVVLFLRPRLEKEMDVGKRLNLFLFCSWQAVHATLLPFLLLCAHLRWWCSLHWTSNRLCLFQWTAVLLLDSSQILTQWVNAFLFCVLLCFFCEEAIGMACF